MAGTADGPRGGMAGILGQVAGPPHGLAARAATQAARRASAAGQKLSQLSAAALVAPWGVAVVTGCLTAAMALVLVSCTSRLST